MRSAVVLLSGGLDSATVVAIARQRGFDLYCLTIDYGQRHRVEIEAAKKIAVFLGARRHLTVSIDMRAIGASALTSEIPVPQGRSGEEIASGIPATYVPARNTIFLSYALAFAESIKTGDIFIGVNAVDYSGYPDCRPEYIAAFETMANLACKAAIEKEIIYKIHTPIISMSKKEIIVAGIALGMDYSLTISCYNPDESGRSCGECDACFLRKKGFSEAGIADSAHYQR